MIKNYMVIYVLDLTEGTYLNRSHKPCKHFVSLAKFCPSAGDIEQEQCKS